MATPQLSPGILIREVDLTVGRADNVLDNVGAIAGPFIKGPVEEAVDISTEQDLINVFGKPTSKDAQYEYWMTASAFLSYGGVLKVVRTTGGSLSNANATWSNSSESAFIKNYDHYEANYADQNNNYHFAAKTAGSWSNGIKVCVIDGRADQIIGINTVGTGATVGCGVSFAVTDINLPSASGGGISTFTGYLKGIVTDVRENESTNRTEVDVKLISKVSESTTQYDLKTTTTLAFNLDPVSGVGTIFVTSVAGITTSNLISIPGISTYSTIVNYGTSAGVGIASTTDAWYGTPYITLNNVSAGSTVSAGELASAYTSVNLGAVETPISYAIDTQGAAIFQDEELIFIDNSGDEINDPVNVADVSDWFDNQYISLDSTVIYWNSIAPKPETSSYADERGAVGDEIHIVVIDDSGKVTGVQGNILEKHLGLSKSLDAVSAVNSPQRIYWRNYLGLYSNYIYGTGNPDTNGVNVGFANTSGGWGELTSGKTNWEQPANGGHVFSAIGSKVYGLAGGTDYQGVDSFKTSLGSLITAYNLFSNRDEIQVDYLLGGPSLEYMYESQAKANHLISIANVRRDCMAVISPHRGDVVGLTNTDTQTDNIVKFFSPLSSSSYAVFDSGYKYTFDRFNNKFRFIPCNGDIAGLMVRTGVYAYPWFSPAGQQRGILNNAIKLAYNPNKAQRDQLYGQRINSIVNQPGIGILLFGDKTALGYASAFDRINVRRLFLTLEQALERSANAQLFELNDRLTRANFVNIVEPYLRDVQAKRGLYGFAIVCDERNNTPEVIDNNEFRADIFLKPTKSINYVTLTFVATRTGVAFEEVIGSNVSF